MRPSRVQGAFISEAEVERVVSAAVEAGKGRTEPSYVEEVTEPRSGPKEAAEPDDELLPEVAGFVVATQQASVSAVQRRFRVGYSRAGRIIDALERKGVVGPHEGSKSRSVVATEIDLEAIFGASGAGGGEGVGAGWFLRRGSAPLLGQAFAYGMTGAFYYTYAVDLARQSGLGGHGGRSCGASSAWPG